MPFQIIIDQHERKRLSSPQDLGAPPEIPEGEDSLKNWPRFILNAVKIETYEIKGQMKTLFWIIIDQNERKRLSSPQDLGAPPEIPKGEDSLKNLPRLKPNSVKIKVN